MDIQENNAFVTDDLPEEVEIIGISFRGSSKIYYFAANGNTAKDGDNAIVETARGMEYGKVTLVNSFVKRDQLVLPLKNVIRIANADDDMRYEANREKEKEAFETCCQKIIAHKLDMKLIDVEYTFDNSKLLFYFTSDDRVDFRELVKDLAGYFRTRIELRQIGIRDEAKIMGGLGICGRPFCCSTFLPDFVQVSIKMAKEQNLSLNAAKISGACGRLMCCLRYEYDTYQEEMRRMPKVDTKVITPDGVGTVSEVKVLQNVVKVVLDGAADNESKVYHLTVLKPFDKNTPVDTPARVPEKEQPKKEENKGHREEEQHSSEEKKSTDGDRNQGGNKNNRHNRNKKNKGGHSGSDRSQNDAQAVVKNGEANKPENKNDQKTENKDKNRQGGAGAQSQQGKNKHHGHQGGKKEHEEKKTSQPQASATSAASTPTAPAEKPAFGEKGAAEGKKQYAPLPSNSIKKKRPR